MEGAAEWGNKCVPPPSPAIYAPPSDAKLHQMEVRICTFSHECKLTPRLVFLVLWHLCVDWRESSVWVSSSRSRKHPRVSEWVGESQLPPRCLSHLQEAWNGNIHKYKRVEFWRGAESSPASFPHISAGPGRGPLITQPRGSMLMMPIITTAVGERNGRSILKGSHGNPLRPLYCKSPGLLEQWLTEQQRCSRALWFAESLRNHKSSIIWTIGKNIRKNKHLKWSYFPLTSTLWKKRHSVFSSFPTMDVHYIHVNRQENLQQPIVLEITYMEKSQNIQSLMFCVRSIKQSSCRRSNMCITLKPWGFKWVKAKYLNIWPACF